MKKSICVCAIAAAVAGPVAAQSDITIYGRLDVGVTKQDDGTSALAGGNGQTGAAGNRWDVRGASSSRLGVRVREDLGNGLQAGALLEHRLNADTGAQQNANVMWNGRSIVELGSSAAGTLYLGRDYLPAYWIADALDPFGGDTVGRTRDDYLLAAYRVDGDVRSNNTVGYRSPVWGGFSAQLAVSAGEGVRTSPANKRAVGGHLRYSAGPVYVGLGVDQVDSSNRLWVLGAAYDLGVVRPMVAYSTSKVANLERKAWSVGVTAPLGAGRLKAAYARLDPAGLNNMLAKFGLGYEHALSKRTALYADVGSAKREGLTRTTAFDLGVKHNF
jgi:predicted porin